MEPSTPTGFAVRLLEVDADILDGALDGLFDDEKGFLGERNDHAADIAPPSPRPPDNGFGGLPPPH